MIAVVLISIGILVALQVFKTVSSIADDIDEIKEKGIY